MIFEWSITFYVLNFSEKFFVVEWVFGKPFSVVEFTIKGKSLELSKEKAQLY